MGYTRRFSARKLVLKTQRSVTTSPVFFSQMTMSWSSWWYMCLWFLCPQEMSVHMP